MSTNTLLYIVTFTWHGNSDYFALASDAYITTDEAYGLAARYVNKYEQPEEECTPDDIEDASVSSIRAVLSADEGEKFQVILRRSR